MRLYLFSNLSQIHDRINPDQLRKLIHRISDQTDTSDLVTALYLWPGHFRTRGTAYVQRWLTPGQFLPRHGYWLPVRAFGIPADLPERFKLIRMRLDGKDSAYPKKETDIYGWEFHYPDIQTHLACLFAHELHHFRRYHLGLHPGEGEHSANRWALEQVQNLGYTLEFQRMKKRQKKRSRSNKKIWMNLINDPFSDFRGLVRNDRVKIVIDPRKKYSGQNARVLRPIRTHSKRLVIETLDGKEWRWPMTWLAPCNQATEI